ncbi:MAG: hypothetical protein AAFV86_01770 [Pseudomonadota bacterium]
MYRILAVALALSACAPVAPLGSGGSGSSESRTLGVGLPYTSPRTPGGATTVLLRRSPQRAIDDILAGARAIGAEARVVSGDTVVVTYSGTVQPYVDCGDFQRRRSSGTDMVDAAAPTATLPARQSGLGMVGRGVSLDARSTLSALPDGRRGTEVVTSTVYVVTVNTFAPSSGERTVRSVSFSDRDSARFDDGVSCMATGELVRVLAGGSTS